MEFYVYLNGARRGPFTEERVQSLLADGVLLPTDLAADEATTDWKPLSALRKSASTGPAPARSTRISEARRVASNRSSPRPPRDPSAAAHRRLGAIGRALP